MFQRICEFALSRNISLAAYPAFLWRETTVEESQKADIEENADIEVIFPISEFIETAGDE